ncbi:MAG: hypothetical protein ACK5LR_05440 [Mangrovibacterium sp.]
MAEEKKKNSLLVWFQKILSGRLVLKNIKPETGIYFVYFVVLGISIVTYRNVSQGVIRQMSDLQKKLEEKRMYSIDYEMQLSRLNQPSLLYEMVEKQKITIREPDAPLPELRVKKID